MSTSTPPRVYRIKPDGNVSTLYYDDGPDLGNDVRLRASEVEPNPDGGWDVVLTDHPNNGKYAGHVVARGVAKRKDAIALEVAFINEHCLGENADA
jgi:hypothetical protein